MGAAITTVHKAEAVLHAIILIVRVVGGEAAALQVEHCASMLGSLGKPRAAGAPAAHVLAARTTEAAEEPAARTLGPIARCIDCNVNLRGPSGFHLAALVAGDHQPRKRCFECRAGRDKARVERDKARDERAERYKARDERAERDKARDDRGAGSRATGGPIEAPGLGQGVASAIAGSLGKGGKGRKVTHPPALAPIRATTFAPTSLHVPAEPIPSPLTTNPEPTHAPAEPTHAPQTPTALAPAATDAADPNPLTATSPKPSTPTDITTPTHLEPAQALEPTHASITPTAAPPRRKPSAAEESAAAKAAAAAAEGAAIADAIIAAEAERALAAGPVPRVDGWAELIALGSSLRVGGRVKLVALGSSPLDGVQGLIISQIVPKRGRPRWNAPPRWEVALPGLRRPPIRLPAANLRALGFVPPDKCSICAGDSKPTSGRFDPEGNYRCAACADSSETACAYCDDPRVPSAGLDTPSFGAHCAACTATEAASPCEVCQGPRALCFSGQDRDLETQALLCGPCERAGPAVCYTCGRRRALGSTFSYHVCPACAPGDYYAARKIPSATFV